MTSGIYAYYDTLKDEVAYIGKSVNINHRHKQHTSPSMRDVQVINRILQNNINRYDLIILKECDVEELDHLEMELIGLFNPKFNFTIGGEGAIGFKMSDDARSKISKALKGVPKSKEHIKKVSEGNKGKTISDEDKQKKSVALKQFYKDPKNHEKKSKQMRKYSFCGNNARYRKDLVSEDKPKKCFHLTYDWKPLNIGFFHEWISCDIIADLINQELKE